MAKINWKPGTLLYPLPAVMVSCGANKEEYNIITIAWTGIINTNPPMCYISIRSIRHSYPIIKRNKEFVINLTTKDLSKATDWCGVRSGKNYDKFNETGLTPGKADFVKCPIIEESPLNIECKVKQIIKFGSHDMFISEIVNIKVNEELMDEKTGQMHLEKAGLINYSHGFYYGHGDTIGKFGFSVKKRKARKKKKK